MSNSQLHKLKSAIKNETEVIPVLSSNLIENSDYETNFPHKLSLTGTQVSKILKAFENSSSTNIKISKTHLSEMIRSGEILSDLLAAIPQLMFLTRAEALKRGLKMCNISKKCSTRISWKSNRILLC